MKRGYAVVSTHEQSGYRLSDMIYPVQKTHQIPNEAVESLGQMTCRGLLKHFRITASTSSTSG
jgi:hypothetical protein